MFSWIAFSRYYRRAWSKEESFPRQTISLNLHHLKNGIESTQINQLLYANSNIFKHPNCAFPRYDFDPIAQTMTSAYSQLMYLDLKRQMRS